MDPGFQLYLVTDRRLCGGSEEMLNRVKAAVDGGVDAVQLREKDLGGKDLRNLAAALARICRDRGARLLINDRIDVALAVDADGVHLPSDSFRVADARRLLGSAKLIGVSTHSAADVARAHADKADFAVLGPIFATPSKVPYGPPLGLEPLRVASAPAGIPVLAIGGIDPDRLRAVCSAGARGVAVVSALLGASDPGATAAAIRRELANFR
jgi:thiamine-phosphate pyrophosphorylase